MASTIKVDKIAQSSGTPEFTIPTADGTAGQFLKTDGSGVLAFDTVTTNPLALTGSTNTWIPTITAADALTGTANFTYDGTTLGVKNSGTASDVKVYCETANSHYTSIKSAAHAAYTGGSWTMTLPGTDGAADEFLQTDGAGATTWADAGGGLVLQVIGATKTNTESTASTTYVSASLSVTITSASTASRFLLTLAGGQVSNSTLSKECLTTFYVDTGSGAAEVSDTGPYELHKQDNYHATNRAPHSAFCLHSPATAGSITYYCYFKTSSGGTAHFNTSTARCQFNVMELSS
jgi:hypothetical protein